LTPDTPARPGQLLRQTVSGQRWRVLGSAAFFMSWQACESLVPVAIGAVIQQAIGTHDGRRMAWWVLILAGQFLVLSLSYRFGARLSRSAAEYAGHGLRVRIADAVLDPRRLPDPEHRPATTVSIAGSDADRVGAFCGLFPRTAGSLVSVVVATVVLLRISIPLGLLVLLGAPVLLAVVHLLGAPLERRSGAEQEGAAHAASLATDLMDGLRVLKGFRGEAVAARRYRGASRASMQATLRAARAETAYEAATALATMVFLALVALVGGRLAADGRIDVGDLVAAVGLAQFLIGPLSSLSYTGASLARARASAARVLGVLAGERRDDTGVPLPEPPRGELVLTRPPIRLGAGEILGVVASPADASALVEALAEAPYADTGVLLDGVAPATAALEPALSRMLVARHDHQLFGESVRANVSAAATDEALVAAALVASDTDQVAATLPAELDSIVGERGRSLSGGQRQRVALARALATDAEVLVLHDPTTAVDAATEARIAAGIGQLRRGHSTLVVTTSPALLAACDRVVHVVDGAVVSAGSHADLLGSDTAYREQVLA